MYVNVFQESSVGFEIRFVNNKPRDKGAITFCTTGIIFQMLRSDPALSKVSHIILDEVHERDLFTDILLGSNGLGPTIVFLIGSTSSGSGGGGGTSVKLP